MYIMKCYTVSLVRERLAEALDDADRGVPVVIERRGVRYRLVREQTKTAKRRRRAPAIEILDPAVTEGQWTWDWHPAGLRFRPRRKS